MHNYGVGKKALDSLLQTELSRHPLGQEVLELAARSGADLNDFGTLARVIAGVKGDGAADENATDARVILILSAMVDKVAAFAAREGLNGQPGTTPHETPENR